MGRDRCVHTAPVCCQEGSTSCSPCNAHTARGSRPNYCPLTLTKHLTAAAYLPLAAPSGAAQLGCAHTPGITQISWPTSSMPSARMSGFATRRRSTGVMNL